jgi:EAL domain-containing protein (putative c-di-GMP-specific phosphodiesterase class I)
MWLESAGISQFQGHLFASPRHGGSSHCLAGEKVRIVIKLYTIWQTLLYER